MKRFAIFDMDGLLVDTEKVYQRNWHDVAVELGLTPHPDFPRSICGTGGETGMAVIRKFYPDVDVRAYHDEVHRRTMEELRRHVDLKPGAAELVRYLHGSGVALALASSSSFEAIHHHLEYTGLAPYFPVVVSGLQVQNSKPAPDVFLLAAKELGAPPEDCYVFEDGVNGGLAGIAAGCTTVLVPDLVPIPPELAQQAAGVFPSLFEVQAAIQAGEL